MQGRDLITHRLDLTAAVALSRVPYFRGRDRLRRRLFRRVSTSGPVCCEVDGFTLDLDLSDALSQEVFLTRRFPGDVASFLDRVVRPGDFVIDVGANIGYTTLAAARRATESGAVLAVEPAHRAFASLSRNLARSGFDWVRAQRVACFDSDGEAELFVAELSGEYSSLRPCIEDLKSNVERIPMRRLDSLLASFYQPPAVIKVDAEGAEWPILRGLGEHLEVAGPLLIVEVSDANVRRFGYEPREMLQWLMALGYSLFVLRDGQLSPLVGEGAIPARGFIDVVARSPAWLERDPSLWRDQLARGQVPR